MSILKNKTKKLLGEQALSSCFSPKVEDLKRCGHISRDFVGNLKKTGYEIVVAGKH